MTLLVCFPFPFLSFPPSLSLNHGVEFRCLYTSYVLTPSFLRPTRPFTVSQNKATGEFLLFTVIFCESPAHNLSRSPVHIFDCATGGTRVYPGTHRNASINPPYSAGVELDMEAGDAIIFDGLLQHQGTENTTVSPPVERYFYYVAICTGEDPNTEVTGKTASTSAPKRRKAKRAKVAAVPKEGAAPAAALAAAPPTKEEV